MAFYNPAQFHGIFSSCTLSKKPLWYSDMSLVSLQVNSAIRLSSNIDDSDFFGYKNLASLNSSRFMEKGIVGVGNSYSLNMAYQKAYSEAIERTCCLLSKNREIVVESPNKLRKSKVPFVVPHTDYDNDIPLSFTTVLPLGAHEQSDVVLYPATHVYLGISDNTCCNESLSSGMAAHISFDQAILSGLLELVERDSFILFWLTRSGFRKLNITPYLFNNNISKMYGDIARSGISINLYDISSDLLIPTILCYVRQNIFPYNLISAAAGLTYENAIEHCISEIMLGLISYTLTSREKIIEQFDNIEKNTSAPAMFGFPDGGPIRLHSDWYACDSSKTKAFEFLNEEDGVALACRAREFSSLKELTDHLLDHKVKVYYKSINSNYLFSADRFVVSLVSPDLVPLYNKESYRPLSNIRLARTDKNIRSFNEWPHPFP